MIAAESRPHIFLPVSIKMVFFVGDHLRETGYAIAG
jgi:hypothetical protein